MVIPNGNPSKRSEQAETEARSPTSSTVPKLDLSTMPKT